MIKTTIETELFCWAVRSPLVSYNLLIQPIQSYHLMIRWLWRWSEEKLFCPFNEFVADSALAAVDMVMDDLNVSTVRSKRTRCIIYQSMVLISIWCKKIKSLIWLHCLPKLAVNLHSSPLVYVCSTIKVFTIRHTNFMILFTCNS